MANHLTPSELADEINMKTREVISKCMEMNVPIFNGRIDKTLFISNLRKFASAAKAPAGHRLAPTHAPACPPRACGHIVR